MWRGSSITRATATARRSTIGSGSSSTRAATSRRAKSCCTTTSTSAPTSTPTRTRSSTPAGAAPGTVAAPSSPLRRRTDPVPAAALRVLLEELIDYAGLFPPASLPLPDVAHNYGAYRRSADAWALGRLVVPASRLEELALLVPSGERWPVSALLGD